MSYYDTWITIQSFCNASFTPLQKYTDCEIVGLVNITLHNFVVKDPRILFQTARILNPFFSSTHPLTFTPYEI